MADSDTDDTPVTPRRRPSRKKSKRGQVSALANSGGGGLRQSLSDHNIPGLFQSFRANKWLSNDTDVPTSDDEGFARTPLSHQVSRTSITGWPSAERDLSEAELGRRKSHAASVLMGAEMRSQRLIGSTNPRYRWEQYWKPEAELKKMRKPVRKYYERNNDLIQQYRYIDELLDSSLPHDLIEEYSAQVAQSKGYGTATGMAQADVPETIDEEEDEEIRPRVYPERHGSFDSIDADGNFWANGAPPPPMNKVKRTPKDIYRLKKDEHNANGNANGNENGNLNASVNNNANKQANGTTEPNERQPLLGPAFNGNGSDSDLESGEMPPDLEYEEEADTSSPVVRRAIWVNTGANFILLILKLIVVVMSSSVSVLASLVDAALDFLSTAIVSVTTWMISRTDQYAYPIGRRRLEPVGVLVFSVIMITAFLQVFYEAFMKLTGGDREVVELSTPAIVIMASTVVVKGLCWVYCRLIKNSSVQALAQDAVTDVVFNTFSIIFPLVGYAANIWWLDPLGGVVLSLYVIVSWSHTANEHICNLAGQSATADERSTLLYLTMRFAKTIKHIQGLQAYHSGDKLNVEVDIVLDEKTSLRDSHDLGESLQYVLESVPKVDRAFVHMDYLPYNLPTHMSQDS